MTTASEMRYRSVFMDPGLPRFARAPRDDGIKSIQHEPEDTTMTAQRWIAETLFDELGFRMTFAVERVLYELATEHQHLVLFENKLFGKVLMLDGATQVTTRDEFIYHEMMTHVPILAHGRAREVLIIGGGDCGIAEEVLKHKAIERLTQVEIDASVVE